MSEHTFVFPRARRDLPPWYRFCFLILAMGSACRTEDDVNSSADEDTSGRDSDTSGGSCENPAYSCAPYPCDDDPSACTSLSQFDERGCLRPLCGSDGDCPAGQVCYLPCNFGDCVPAVITRCTDKEPMLPGECICTHEIGCSAGGWCVAQTSYPPGEDPMSCMCEEGWEPCGSEPELQCCDFCPGPNNYHEDGLCYCSRGYEWCNPNDPDDLACCRVGG